MGYVTQIPKSLLRRKVCRRATLQCWIIPDTVNGYPPLKSCSTADFSSANAKKRFGDLCKLMRKVESCARESNVYVEHPNIAQAQVMLDTWIARVNVAAATPKGRVRRVGQLKWTTLLKILREENVQ